MALSDILENLTKPAPSFVDTENDFGDNTGAQLADKDKDEVETFGSTKLRRQAISLLSDTDSKYAGKKTSRKQIYEDVSENVENGDVSDGEDDNESTGELDSEDENEIESFNKDMKAKFQNGSVKDLGSDGFSDEDDDEEMEKDDDEMEDGDDDDGGGGDDDNDVEEETDEDDVSNDGEERNETIERSKREEKDVQSFSKLDIEGETAKGKAVQFQLGLLDNLLEARIKIQRIVSSMNQIPQPDTWTDFMNEGVGTKFSAAVTKVQGSLCNVMNSLVELQTTVLMKNPQTRHIVTGEKAKEEDSNEDIFSDLDDEDDDSADHETLNDSLKKELKRKLTMDQFPMFLIKRARKFEPYRNSTIQKWDDKTKLSSGKMSSKSFNALDQSAMKQVKQILYDKERLIKRTQLRRSIYKVFGKPEEDQTSETLKKISPQDNLRNRDPEIFDDSDFYHMLLQDYIRRKSTESSDAAATTKQWMEIQQLRSKMKRKIDTRATKGRKIRYEVHKKLVNFMGPYDNSNWTQEMRDELYRSLFGQQCTITKD